MNNRVKAAKKNLQLRHVMAYVAVLHLLVGNKNRTQVQELHRYSAEHPLTTSCDATAYLIKNINIIPDLPRKAEIAHFRLTAGHDHLVKHLQKINSLPSSKCLLCNHPDEQLNDHKCFVLKQEEQHCS